ncbi:MAG: histidine phosphatase family protein [Rhodospirillaceae bacterium]|jgi:phosphohistidine phosphatase
MKRLYLLRHAKSSWNQLGQEDHERPLNERGRRNAVEMGQFMRAGELFPNLILCSSSERTRETCSILLSGLELDINCQFTDELYLATAATMLTLIHETSDQIDSLMVISHAPGVADAALMLGQNGNGAARNLLEQKYQTGALTIFDSDADRWIDVGPESCRLIDFIRPRYLPGGAA